MTTAVVAVVVAATGVGLTFLWNWLKYLSDRRNQLAAARMDAYAGLLASLHLLNNAHSLEPGQTSPSEAQLEAARHVRDQVWQHQARIELVAPEEVRTLAANLVREYQSSSLERKDRRPIDRQARKGLRSAFLQAARADLPGVASAMSTVGYRPLRLRTYDD